MGVDNKNVLPRPNVIIAAERHGLNGSLGVHSG